MEKELFDWDGWDQHDTMAFAFFNCVMKKDFGLLKKGQEIPTIYLNYDYGTLEVLDDEGNVTYTIKMVLSPIR